MDVAGARALRERIDRRQQDHWVQAAAVRSGLQDASDPDREHLVRCHGGMRIYRPFAEPPFAKAVVGDRWPSSLFRAPRSDARIRSASDRSSAVSLVRACASRLYCVHRLPADSRASSDQSCPARDCAARASCCSAVACGWARVRPDPVAIDLARQQRQSQSDRLGVARRCNRVRVVCAARRGFCLARDPSRTHLYTPQRGR